MKQTITSEKKICDLTERELKRLKFISENNGQIFVMNQSIDWGLIKNKMIWFDIGGYLRTAIKSEDLDNQIKKNCVL